MARPEIASAERRSQYIAIRLTQDEKDLICKTAKSVGISPAIFARNCIILHAEAWVKKIEQAAQS